MGAGFIQLERWRGLLLCRVCGERCVHPALAGGMVGADLWGSHSTFSIVVEERLVQAMEPSAARPCHTLPLEGLGALKSWWDRNS